MGIVLKDGVWVGHLLSVYSLPTKDPNQNRTLCSKKEIGGSLKQLINVAYEATRSSFHGGEIIAHLD